MGKVNRKTQVQKPNLGHPTRQFRHERTEPTYPGHPPFTVLDVSEGSLLRRATRPVGVSKITSSIALPLIKQKGVVCSTIWLKPRSFCLLRSSAVPMAEDLSLKRFERH